MFDYTTCSKDELAEYGKTFGLNLDLRKSLDTLVEQVRKAEAQAAAAAGAEPPPEAPDGKQRYYKNRESGRMFLAKDHPHLKGYANTVEVIE